MRADPLKSAKKENAQPLRAVLFSLVGAGLQRYALQATLLDYVL